MADKKINSRSTDLDSGLYFPVAYHDNGDGTYNMGVTVSGNVEIGTSVEISNDTGNPIPIDLTGRICTGMETIAVTTATPVTLTIPAGSVAAQVQADGSAVSLSLDGTNPTASDGIRIDDGIIFYVDSALANVKAIARTTDCNLQVAYFNKA